MGYVVNSDQPACELLQKGSKNWFTCHIKNYARVAYERANNLSSTQDSNIQQAIRNLLYHDSNVVKEYDQFLTQLMLVDNEDDYR